MSDIAISNLAAAITLQSVKDFVSGTEKERNTILDDLRSQRMQFITRGKSLIVADQLEKHPAEIAARLRSAEMTQ